MGSDGTASCGARDPADVAEAVAWLGGIEGVDPTRMGVVGISEGGRVALMAAARSHLVRSVVAFSPETDLVRLRATPTRQLVLLQNWRSLLAEPGTTPAAAQQ